MRLDPQMSAEQTARWIERHAAAGVDATCRPGSDGWDYTCTLTGGRVNESTYGYKVNDRGVTDFSF
jgi:hypothetical protein